ncbi:MAG: hypothetical protein IKB70_02650 [Bacilli bacterium]|nr:hypothetical protein [Bacilli bacterium]
MKKILALVPALLLLASCGGSSSTLWNEEDALIMKTHLNGHYLPFIQLDELTVEYNREKDCVSLNAPFISVEQLDAYQQTILDNGYQEVIEDCLIEQYTSLGLHTFTKSVDNGIIYIDTYAKDGYEISTSGEFHADAYFYDIVAGENEPISWTVVEERIMETYLYGYVLPECEVANNIVTFEPYIDSDEYTPDEEKGTVTISAPYASSKEVQTYLSKLIDAKFVSVTTGYEDKGFFEVKLGIDEYIELHVQVYTYENDTYIGTSGEFYADAFCVAL